MPLPTAAVGAERLRSGVTFAVAGDPVAAAVVAALGGRAMAVEDRQRTTYHAAASIAANHLVALIGQVERVAASVGLPLEAFAGLIHAAIDDALELGPRQALTGPASRGDWDTVERHRRALSTLAGPRTELAGYDAMVGLARRLSLEVDPVGDDADGANRRCRPGPGSGPSHRGPGFGAGGMSTVVAEAPSAVLRPTTPGTAAGGAGVAVIGSVAAYSECAGPGAQLGPVGGRGAHHGRPPRRPPVADRAGRSTSATWWRCPSS